MSADIPLATTHKFSNGLPAKGPGRPKGSPNKIGKAAKDAIAAAADGLGGHQRLVEWAKEDPANERAFWVSVYPKLIPVQIAGDPDNPVQTSLTVTFK